MYRTNYNQRNAMDKQKEIFEKLCFGPFVSNLTSILFSPWKAKGDICYSSANYKVQEPNLTRPDDHRKRFEHDVIMTLVHCGERLDKGRTRKKIVDRYILSIEIKTSVKDIWETSVDKYLGATRLFFIAAPSRLLPAIIERYDKHPRKDLIGIIDADTGEIVALPRLQNFIKDRSDRLLARCYTSEHRYPFCSEDVEPYEIHRVIEIGNPAPEWIDYTGLRVNKNYLNFFCR